VIEWVVDQPGLRLGLGDSADYDGDADLVFSHLYGPLPKQLIGKPAIVNVFGDRKAQAEAWCGAELIEISRWGRGLTNTIFVCHLDAPQYLDLTDLVEDEFTADRGWFPEALVDRLLVGQVNHGDTIIDLFMGRGTVGKVVRALGLDFIGIDREPNRVEIARRYLGV